PPSRKASSDRSPPASPTASSKPSTAMSRPPSARPRATEPNETSKPSSTSSPATCSLIHPLETATSPSQYVPSTGAFCKIQLARRISPSLGIVSGRGSGRRGPELRDAENLIDGERDDAEHEVAFDLDRAAHADDPCAEFVLQSGVDAFGHGSKIKEPVVGIGHVDEFHALDFFGPFGLGFVLGAIVAVDDRRMAERLAVVMDGGGVVGRIHQVVEI